MVKSMEASTGSVKISVESPQFIESLKEYQLTRENGQVSVKDLGASANPFVEMAIKCVFSYLVDVQLANNLQVVIQADNDFYSQWENVTAYALMCR
jgi:phosphomevalonate kinase